MLVTPDGAQNIAMHWLHLHYMFQTINVVALVIITVGSITVGVNNTSFITEANRNKLAFLVAVCSALYGTFQPAGQAGAYGKASTHISDILRVSDDRSQLSEAIMDGERILDSQPAPTLPEGAAKK